MITYRIVDHTEEVNEEIARRVQMLCDFAAKEISAAYRSQTDGLGATQAPPHSDPGQIPHYFNGRDQDGLPNNKPPEFARAQEQPLYKYIRPLLGAGMPRKRSIKAVVGFGLNGHVANRRQNYLIRHDRQDRPWVIPIYLNHRDRIAARVINALGFVRQGQQLQ